ncbi:uncharacterized protein LOC143559795 [Bidens hawaiensis]|uniref:uncharacterized protein LOC143559795 n=1 Tax=Bidens hawaiensis TaxID=980011 RepID=UPI00404A5E53
MEGGNIRIFGDWMKGATTVTGISEAQDALFLLSDVNFSGSRDLWIWDDNHSDGFSVANVKAAMKKNLYDQPVQRMWWENWIPIKVNILFWRIEKERVPTCSELVKRGIPLSSTTCSLCSSEEETASHVFVNCRFSFEVWCKVWSWCRLLPTNSRSVEEMIAWQNTFQTPERGKKIVRCIFMITCWAI